MQLARRSWGPRMSDAFGVPIERLRPDIAGREARADELQAEGPHRHPCTRISDELFAAINGAVTAAREAHKTWIGDSGGAKACIASFACNDLWSLLEQVVVGDGRAAARSARALFEHTVHLKYISDPTDGTIRGQRYLEHAAVHAQQMAGVDLVSELQGEQAKKERTKQSRLAGASRAAFRTAMSRWGKDFRRQWSDRNLREMAKTVGLDGDYDAYRVLSGVTHGSVGGLQGAIRVVKGEKVHRFGPDLELSSLAFLLGVRWWRDLAQTMPDSPARAQVLQTAKELLLLYPELLQRSRELDQEWWPKHPPARAVPLLAVYPGGARRWFIYDQVADSLQLATPPAPDSVPEWLDEKVAELMPQIELRAYAGAGTGRPMTLAVGGGLKLLPKPGAKVVPAAPIMIPPELKPQQG